GLRAELPDRRAPVRAGGSEGEDPEAGSPAGVARHHARGAGMIRPVGPILPFRSLDTVWIQITGTQCNIACRHCFVSAGPRSTSLAVMSRDQVEAAITEAAQLGARDAYFTGGEPFLHPEIRSLVEFALERMPLTILTNALLIDDETAAWI